MNNKYEIGDKVFVKMTITSVTVSKKYGIIYDMEIPESESLIISGAKDTMNFLKEELIWGYANDKDKV